MFFKRDFLVIILATLTLVVDSKQKINVMVSRTESFLDHSIEKRALERLEMKIIENFGMKFNLEIQYIVANQILNEAFSTEDRCK